MFWKPSYKSYSVNHRGNWEWLCQHTSGEWESLLMLRCLSPLGLLQENTMNWVVYEPHTSIFHNSGKYKMEIASRFSVWWGPTSWFKKASSFYVLKWHKGEGCSLGLLSYDHPSYSSELHSDDRISPKDPTLSPKTLLVKFSTYGFGGRGANMKAKTTEKKQGRPSGWRVWGRFNCPNPVSVRVFTQIL